MATIDDLFSLLTELCTFEQIKSVLESARGNKGVRLSAPNKGELLNKNLREALNANALPIERVYDLLRDAEENGDQHVLYYRVPKALQKGLTFEEFGRKLALPRALTQTFPKLDLVPNGYTIADFRTLGPRRPTDWVLKIYGDETREFFTGRIVPEVGTKHLERVRRSELSPRACNAVEFPRSSGTSNTSGYGARTTNGLGRISLAHDRDGRTAEHAETVGSFTNAPKSDRARRIGRKSFQFEGYSGEDAWPRAGNV